MLSRTLQSSKANLSATKQWRVKFKVFVKLVVKLVTLYTDNPLIN